MADIDGVVSGDGCHASVQNHALDKAENCGGTVESCREEYESDDDEGSVGIVVNLKCSKEYHSLKE